MASPKTGRPRGRPAGSARRLTADPERYAIAYYIARQTLPGAELSKANKPRALASLMMKADYGIVLKSEIDRLRIADAILNGRGFDINMSRSGGLNKPDAEQWRDRHPSHALADGFVDKVDNLAKRLCQPKTGSEREEARWLSLMVNAWKIAIGHYTFTGDPHAAARDLAEKAGELEYFDQVIRPIFLMHRSLHIDESVLNASPDLFSD